MSDEHKTKLFRNGGSQAVRLPAEFRFESDKIYICRDDATGDVILFERPRRDAWRAFIAWRDALELPPGDSDDNMAERPMNRPASGRSVFEDEARWLIRCRSTRISPTDSSWDGARPVDAHFAEANPSRLRISAVTQAELLYGLKAIDPAHCLHLAVRRFLRDIPILP